MIYGPGVADWTEARHIVIVVDALRGGVSPPPPPSSRRSDEIDYEIFGQEMQYVEITLDPRETVVAEAGGMMYMTPGIQMETSVNYDIQFVGGFKNTLFGGEGLIFATLTGPGDVWLQSLPFSRLAGRIFAAAPSRGGKEEGSILGGLGRMLDGD
ncbi:MAG: AIM24 family protein [Planctomycetes bacterium]|nr:AIM24 family protein [Planctomycetota bacterium]